MGLIKLSNEDRKLIQKFRKKCEDNDGTLSHDLNDPEHRKFAKLMHNVAGNNEENFPGLHDMIDNHKTYAANVVAADDGDEEQWVTAFGVPEVGAVQDTQVAASRGYGTVVGGFKTCNLSLLTLDQNGNLLASGASSSQHEGTLAVQTDDSTAKAFTSGSNGLMTYSYTDNNGHSATNSVSGAAIGAISDPVVEQPKRENRNTNSYNPNAICIGLGRPNNLTRCDYIYNETTINNPIGRVPLVGNVTFSHPIQTLQPGTNFNVIIQVVRDSGGQTPTLTPTDMTNVYNNFAIGANPNTLEWNLPMQANAVAPPPVAPPPYNPVVFSNIPWATEMTAMLGVTISVKLDDGSPNGTWATVFIQSSDQLDNDPIDGTKYILPIEFVWHCLGEKTKVLMADGSEKTIPEIKAGDEVRARANGDAEAVTVTHNDHHQRTVFNIETECGKNLTASGEHIIFTDQGGIEARQLEVGMNVETIDGKSSVASVTKEKGNGRVLWNLSLGTAPQRHEKNPNVGQFYGNGILVGDARAKRAERYRKLNDIGWVKANLPEAFYKDVDSTFARRKHLIKN